jgi:hypothetical protein
MRGCKFVQSKKDFNSTLELTNILSALHGFGVVLLQKLKPYSKDLKGQFKSGLYCALKACMSFKPKVDMRMFKFSKALTPSELFIGSAWGNRYPIEKSMLDHLIYTIHREDIDYKVLSSYLLKYEEIEKFYGINKKLHSNKVISKDEAAFIYADFETELQRSVVVAFDSYEELIGVQENFINFSKDLRKYKDICQSLVDTRIKVAYSKLSNQQKKKKPSIESVIQPLKGTVDYVNFFNPCRAVGIPLSFRVGEYPLNKEYFANVKLELEKFLTKYKDKIDEIRIDYVYNWYVSELGNNL